MVQVNLSAIAAVGTLANIIDFQGRAVDLTAGDSGDYVPIQVSARANSSSQQVYSIHTPLIHLF